MQLILFMLLFDVQVDKLLQDQDSLAVSAPTGTGKTVVFEIAILALFAGKRSGYKAVYLAPSKFLVAQVHFVHNVVYQGRFLRGTFQRLMFAER